MNKVALVNVNSFGKYFPEFIRELEDKIGEVQRFTLPQDISAEDLSKELQDFTYLIVGTVPKFTKEFFVRTPSVKYVARFGIGYNNVDVPGALACDVMVSNIPGYLEKDDVAEQAAALLIAVAKHLTAADEAVHKGEWNVDRGRFLGKRIKGCTVGVIGFGNIGSRFAEIMKNGFDARILAYDPFLSEEDISSRGGIKAELDELAAQSDIISLHMNMSQDNYHLVDENLINKMKDGVILINSARGELVDETAVVNALKSRKLGGFGTDVMEAEPPKMDHPLLELKNVVITPHLATYNTECNHMMCRSVVDDVISVKNGGKPSHLLDQ